MQAFYALIDRLDRCGAGEKQVLETMLWDTFGIEACVLALDMSGFSRTVRAHGIVSYLARIRRMQQTSAPIVAACGGEVVKYTADNLMAVFTDARQALAAAGEIRRACGALPEPLEVSIGLDRGRFLYVPYTDCFGDPVNVAFKLAEDIAEAGEVLASAAVFAATGTQPGEPWQTERISGLQIDYATVPVG
jgi:class 3 adenylate cyclase